MSEQITSAQVQPWPLVTEGDSQHPVPSLQYLLRKRNHPVMVDGIFGPRTATAVRAFQTEKNLAVDGDVGPRTWAALVVQTKKGDTGDQVRAVQYEANFRAGEGEALDVDGDFGPATDRWVRGFQEAVGVAVDGIVGPVTWRALVSGMLAG